MQELCWLGLLLLMFVSQGESIKCYVCDNASNQACGEHFKVYQFQTYECPENSYCGKQTQPPLTKGWVGVMRNCYAPGSLAGINETMGCHNWTNPMDNFTALFCFCDTDMCNGSPWLTPVYHLTLAISAFTIIMQFRS